MHVLNPKKVALVVGSFAALMHVIWSVLVGLGLAQAYLNFVLGMHFLNNPYTVANFSFGGAVGLVFIAFIMGNIIGYIFATVWNRLHR